MINAVIGDVVSASGDTVVLRTTGGLEFSMVCSAQTVARINALQGEARRGVRMLTILSHHEDLMQLYGFAEEKERTGFLDLVEVNGIGPRQALKILSSITVDNLAKALDEGDEKLLSSVPGIGPKTAKKIILQLRGVLVLEPEQPVAAAGERSPFKDLVDSLVAMGYDRRVVETAMAKVESEHRQELDKLNLADQEQFLFARTLKYLG